MGTEGFIRNVVYYDDAHKIQAMGDNSGNLVFQRAVSLLFDNPLIHLGLAGVPYRSFGSWSDCKYLVFPAANHLRENADWSKLSEFLSLQKLPLIVLGLGVQGKHGESEEETIRSIVSDENILQFVSVIKEKAILITVRGELTKKICAILGLNGVISLGCPSITLNSNVKLGNVIDRKIKSISNVGRFALTAIGPFSVKGDHKKLSLERWLLAQLFQRDGLYIQQSDGVDMFKAFNRRHPDKGSSFYSELPNLLAPNINKSIFWDFLRKKGRFFTDFRDWMFYMKDMDLCIGQRFHGNVVGMISEIPTVFLSFDKRTDELIRRCKLPTLDADTITSGRSIEDCLKNVIFCPDDFDANRMDIAKRYVNVFRGLDLKPSRSLLHLANEL